LGDQLEMIVIKALSRDRAERYRNAGELADELSHYLENEPLTAGRATPLFFLRRWVLRHRRAAFIAALIVILNVLLLAWSFQRVAAARAEKAALLEQIRTGKPLPGER